MACASGKIQYFDPMDAEHTRRRMVAQGKTDKSAKRLVVYLCRDCKRYHVGHKRNEPKPVEVKPKPPKKIPSVSELKRRVRNMEKRLDKERRHAAYLWGKIVAADREWLEVESERARIEAERMKDLADTLAIAARLYGR